MTLPSDATGRRLGTLFFGYLAVVVAVITLAPFQFAVPACFTAALIVTDGGWATDVALNVVLFLPFGVLWHRSRAGSIAGALAVGILAGASIEAAQLFLAPRYTTLSDALANGSGAALGAAASVAIARRVHSTTLVTRLWLDQPLMGLVYLLWPLAWLLGLSSGSDPARLWLLIPVAAAGALAISAVACSGQLPVSRLTPIAVTTSWMAAAAVPAARVAPWTAAASVGVALVVAALGGPLWSAALRRDRRIEPQVVRAVLPLLAVLLIGASRHAGSVAVAGGGEAAREALLRVIAQAAAFTLLGYLIAETRGRRREPLRRLVAWPLLSAACAVLVLEYAVAPWPSVTRVLAAMAATAVGAALYDAQRAHILALLGLR